MMSVLVDVAIITTIRAFKIRTKILTTIGKITAMVIIEILMVIFEAEVVEEVAVVIITAVLTIIEIIITTTITITIAEIDMFVRCGKAPRPRLKSGAANNKMYFFAMHK